MKIYQLALCIQRSSQKIHIVGRAARTTIHPISLETPENSWRVTKERVFLAYKE